MNYYPHHIGDYARDTAHLSMVEDGAYRRLLDLCYATEKPLPLDRDKLYRLARATTEEEKQAISIVLGEFFIDGDGGWYHKRVRVEIKKASAKTKAARDNGKKGGRPITQSVSVLKPSGFQSAKPEISQSKAPNSQEPIANSQRIKNTSPPSGEFLRFWATWPKSGRKQSRGQCWERWRKADFDQVAEQVIAHVEAMKLSIDWRKDSGAFIPAPMVYLTQRRWEGADLDAPRAAGWGP